MKREHREAFVQGALALLAEQSQRSAQEALEQWQAAQGLRPAVWAAIDDSARAELATAVERAARTGTTTEERA